MTARLEGDHEDLDAARIERMTDKEIKAEVIDFAVQSGFDADFAAHDPYSALTWVEEQMRAWIDAMPSDEQAEFIARHGTRDWGNCYGHGAV